MFFCGCAINELSGAQGLVIERRLYEYGYNLRSCDARIKKFSE
jgi:hypothetical protein